MQHELQEDRALQDVIEIVVGDQRQDRFSVRAMVNAKPLHVVDLKAGIGLDERAPCQACAGCNCLCREMAQTHLDTLAPAKEALQHQQAPVGQACRVRYVEVVNVLELESLWLSTDPDPARVVAAAAREALGKSDDRALVGAGLERGEGLNAQIGGHALGLGRELQGTGRPSHFSVLHGIAIDAVVALEADEQRAVLQRALNEGGGFGVLLHFAGKRPAVGGEQWAEAGAPEAKRPRALVVHIGAHPAALVGDGKQAPAGGLHDQCRPAAEIVCRRRQNKTAAELERTKALRLGLVALEMLNGARIDLDGLDACGGRIVLGESRREEWGRHAGKEPASDGAAMDGDRGVGVDHVAIVLPRWHPTPRQGSGAQRPTYCSLRRGEGGGKRRGSGPSSSNSSTSLSVMAPASSEGSVMVTARR